MVSEFENRGGRRNKRIGGRPIPEGGKAINKTFKLYPKDIEALQELASILYPGQDKVNTKVLRRAIHFTLSKLCPPPKPTSSTS
jgi:hypothetical protein